MRIALFAITAVALWAQADPVVRSGNNQTTIDIYYGNGDNLFRLDSNGGFRIDSALWTGSAALSLTSAKNLQLANNVIVGWSSTTSSTGTMDTGLYRTSAGVVEVNNGTAGTLRDLRLRTVLAGTWNGDVIGASYLPVASTSASGIAELAIDTEVTTGTDATRAVTPDALAGSSIFGTKVVQVEIYPPGTAAATGDGKTYFYVPPALNGMNLVGVRAQVYTAGTTGTLNIDIARCVAAASGNVCSSTVADMLSTNMTIDTGENATDTAAAAAVIDTANDDVATGQVLRFDIDAIHTTPSQGLLVILTFQLP